MSEMNLPPRFNQGHVVKKKKRGWLKFTLITLLFCFLACAAITVYLYYKFDSMITQVSTEPIVAGNTENPAAPAVEVKSELTTVLLFGLDTRKQTGSLNTDVIMVASFRPDGKTASIVSIPRDTYMKPKGYRARKANAFYAVAMNSDKETANSVVKEIFGDYLDIKIDYITKIDFKTFEDIINQIGGISVNVDMNMHYEDPTDGTSINLKKGVQVLDGKNALDFVRYRKSSDGSTAESSDYERNKRQQEVIAAIVDKAKSFRGLLNLGGMMDAAGNNIKSDFTKSDLSDFIWTYKGLGNDHIHFMALDGTWKSPYSYVDEMVLDKAKVLLKQE